MLSPDRDAIDTLLHDHDLIKNFLVALMHGEVTERKHIIELLKALMILHNGTEENVVYPAIHGIAERPIHARTLYHQHDAAQVAFWEIAHLAPYDAAFLTKATDFRDAVLAHIRQEEEHEFPELRRALGQRVADALELSDEVAAFRRDYGAALFHHV